MDMDFGRLGRFEADFSSPMSLFKRCADCPPQPPPCPACDAGKVCALTSRGCGCPKSWCAPINGADQPQSSPPSPAGPIAGGVVGGIAVVCLMTFLVWRFCIKKRRQQFDEDIWQEAESEKGGEDMTSRPRASMQSVRSIASTVLTRASNVIQIAYIPGVTNRTGGSPDLIPPVPPIPSFSPAHSTTNLPHQQDQHFFMPSDLRDSTYSDYTVDRDSYARSSMRRSIDRGSVPSTAYRGSAVVNTLPAQTAIRGKANPVAVKSNGKNSPLMGTPRSATPPVPIIDRSRHAPMNKATSPIVARLGVPKAVTVTKAPSNNNLATTAIKNAASSNNIASQIKPTKSPKPDRRPSPANSSPRHNGDSSTFDDNSSSDDDSPTPEENPLMRPTQNQNPKPYFPPSKPFPNSSAPDLRSPPNNKSPSPPTTNTNNNPPLSSDRKKQHKRSGSLNQIIQEATRRASKEARHGGLGSLGSAGDWRRELMGGDERVVMPRGRRGEGPFGDENAAGTP